MEKLRSRTADRWIRAGSLLLAFAAFCSVALPWFDLPVLGWSVPAPAWNRTGLLLLALSAAQMTRSLGWRFGKWLVRILVFPIGYYWWGSEAAFLKWGTGTLAPIQLKLVAINGILSKFSVDSIDVFEARHWKNLEAGPGWYLTGATLALTLALTALDHYQPSRCSKCRARVGDSDAHCCQCGHKVREVKGCPECGRFPEPRDKFCRDCGQEIP